MHILVLRGFVFQLKDFTAKPCSSRTGYDFLPKKSYALDLSKLAQGLRLQGIQVEADTPVALLLVIQGTSTSLFKNGKILVKDLKEESKARVIAEYLVQALNEISTQ